MLYKALECSSLQFLHVNQKDPQIKGADSDGNTHIHTTDVEVGAKVHQI